MSVQSDRQALIKLFQRYNVRLGMLYGKFVKELSKLGVSVEDKLQDEPLFMFDHFPELKTRLSDIISDYRVDYVNLYKQGISSGVALAYGQDAKNLHGYTIYNDEAIDRVRTAAVTAFTKQRMSPPFGLSLSQKIWNYLQQTKSEFEVAMSNVITDGLKKGTSAAELSRQVRQQLVNPDMMYRRYHHKVITAGGKEKDVVKWHKRVIDGSGKVRFVEAPLEQVGRGVYRSSYKNSFRLMRTEINMSYHYANNERWKSEPFVIGMRISLSPEHPRYDICNELAGDYPKDFNWACWHPACLCMSSAILCSQEELKDITKRTARGEDMSQYKSPNLITKCPDNFYSYIDGQHDKIIASAERGTLGYYLRDNKKYWTGRFSAAERQQMGITEVSPTKSAKEIAEMRHASRTPEQIAAIQRAWDKRKNLRTLATELNISVGKPMSHEQADFGLSNPHYNGNHDDPYSRNCQSCVVAYEARRRGLDVAAMPNFGLKGTATKELALHPEIAWIDTKTGEKIEFTQIASSRLIKGKDKSGVIKARFKYPSDEEKKNGLDKATKEEGRYLVSVTWKSAPSGHIFCVERLQDGALRSFDPQRGSHRVHNSYLDEASSVRILRVDNLNFNTDLVGKVLTKQSSLRFADITEASAAKGGVLGVPLKEKTELIALKKSIIEKAIIVEDKPYSNLKTGLYYQTKSSFKRGISHTINKDEALAFSIINEHIGDLRFIRESPLGEVKDLSKDADITNINNKIKRGVSSYNIYEWIYKDKKWVVKTEVHKGLSETVYTIYRKK